MIPLDKECLTCRTARAFECAPEHEARAVIGDEYQELHRVFLAAHRLTLGGKLLDGPAREHAQEELESAVMSAQDALPWHLMGPPFGVRP